MVAERAIDQVDGFIVGLLILYELNVLSILLKMETGRFGLRSSALIVCKCVNNLVHSLAGDDSTSWW